MAALTGMGDPAVQALFPGRDTPSSMRSFNGHGHQHGRGAVPQKPFDPTEDDPVEHKSAHSQEQSHYVVAPSIHVQSEFASITRTSDPSQPLTCLVVVELPGKRTNTVPGSVMPMSEPFTPTPKNTSVYREGSNHSVHSGPHSNDFSMSPQSQSQYISADRQSQTSTLR